MRLFSNVLYVVGPDDAAPALARAISLMREEGATLTLVSVVETMVSGSPSGTFHDELAEAFNALRHKRLDHLKLVAAGVPDGIETVCEVMDGRAYMEIIKRVQLYQHDLVVATVSEDSSPANRLFVSEDMQLLRKCPCPLLLLKRASVGAFASVMAAVDFDHADLLNTEEAGHHLNDDIVDLAAVIADQDKSDLHIANVFTVPGEGAMIAGWIPMAPENLSDYAGRCEAAASEMLDQLVQASETRLDLDLFASNRIKTHIVKGRARAEIPALADTLGTDLIVMGTIGRVGIPGFLIGNTAETILGAIDCSVLALKPDGFESPVSPG